MIAFFLFAVGVVAQDVYDFSDYHTSYGKSYQPDSPEYEMRKTIFNLRVSEIVKHNENPDKSYTQVINKFTDWTDAERQSMLGGAGSLLIPNDGVEHVPDVNQTIADELNWCDKGACTPVKNQGSCGSCWAFGAVETMESALFVEHGKLLALSPQEFVDCAPNPDHCGGTGGCQGSTADLAFKYGIEKGIAAEKDYPYTARDGKCKISSTTISAKMSAFTVVKSNDGKALLEAVNKQPIAINVDASSWFSVGSGILPFNAKALTLNHVVQLVGYGTQGGKDYWQVRNSWGGSWGSKGFIKLERFTSAEKAPCGTNPNNQDGVGCKNDPKKVTVCGVSGMLYATSYATGTSLVE